MVRWLLPRAVLALLFLSAAFFAFFESVYLRDQAAEFADVKIGVWMCSNTIARSVPKIGANKFDALVSRSNPENGMIESKKSASAITHALTQKRPKIDISRLGHM